MAQNRKPRKVKIDKNLNEIFLEAQGNYKLLTIHNKRGKTRIPMSNQLNSVDIAKFTRGKNILELQNLGTGDNKISIIKLK